MYDLSIYDSEFFSTNQWEGVRHAEWFVPLLIETFHPKSVVDVGCGTGHFVRAFLDAGIEALGIEGADAAIEMSLAAAHVRQVDLRIPWAHAVRFDLAISIEVAEHIESEYADTFVDTLCSLSDVIVMTAAPPGQGGLQHVNEQPRFYWHKKFSERGYQLDQSAIVELFRGVDNAKMDGHHVAQWFDRNLLVFERG